MTTAAARIQRKVASSTATKAMRTNIVDCTGHLSNDVIVVGSAPSCGLVVSGKVRESSRDDSGNSSSSSSLEQLEQPACRDSLAAAKVDMKVTVEAAIVDANTSPSSASEASSVDRTNTWTDESLFGQDRLWQSVDFISEPEKERLFPTGYEDDEVERHVPLHKTVCCALCRKKQQRQEKLRLQQTQELPCRTSSPTSQSSLLCSPANGHLPSDTVDSGVSHSTFSVDDVEISSSSFLGHSSLPNNASSPAGTNPDEELDAAVNSTECLHGQTTEPSSVRQRHQLHPDSMPADRRSSDISRSGSGSEKGQMRPFSSPQLHRLGADSRQLLTAKDEKQLAVFAAKKRQQREQEVRRELSHQQQWQDDKRLQQQQKQQNRRSGANDNMKMAPSPKSSPGDKGRLSLMRSSSAGSSRRVMSTCDVIVDDTSPTASSYSVRRSVQRSTSALTCQGHGENCGCGRNHNIDPAISSVRSKPSPTIRCRNQDNSASSSPTSDCPCARCAARYGAATLERKHDQSQLYQAEERRNQMERRLEEQRQKVDDLVSQLQEKQEEEQRRLNEIKQHRLSQLAEKARSNDDHARTTVENVKEMERRQEEELQRLQEALEANLSAAELRVKARREEEMNQLKAELQSKIEKSKRKQARMEEELKQWQDSIIRYREMQERNARALAQAQIDSRRSVAAKEREIRERQQKDNLLRMQEQEREWRASVEASIRLKEERSKSLLKEREAHKKQAHEMAAISRQMRDELRLNSSLSDFNRYV